MLEQMNTKVSISYLIELICVEQSLEDDRRCGFTSPVSRRRRRRRHPTRPQTPFMFHLPDILCLSVSLSVVVDTSNG